MPRRHNYVATFATTPARTHARGTPAGVVAAGVPGAGGYDALFAVVLEPLGDGGGGGSGVRASATVAPSLRPGHDVQAFTAAAAASAVAAAFASDGGAAVSQADVDGAAALAEAATETAANGSSVRAAVEAVWLAWPGGGLTPLLLRDGPAAGAPGAGLQLAASGRSDTGVQSR